MQHVHQKGAHLHFQTLASPASLAANGKDPAGLQRVTSTAQLRAVLAAPLGSPGRPAVLLCTVQKLAALWRAGGAASSGRQTFKAGEDAASAAAGSTWLVGSAAQPRSMV